MKKGCTGYLALLIRGEGEKPSLVEIPLVCEYSDIIQDDLLGQPPEREVQFGIDLLPGTTPIWKAPYRMAPAKLKELKTQLKE